MQESPLLRGCVKAFLLFSLAFVLRDDFMHAQTTTQVMVPASSLWTDTGIKLTAGQYAAISASGTWCWGGGESHCNGPDGNPGFPVSLSYDEFEFFDVLDHGRLLAFVGPDPYQGQWGSPLFFPQTSGYISVGSGQTFAGYSGELWLGINAAARTESTTNYSGQLVANITVGGSDTTSPTIKIGVPGRVYLQNQKINAVYSCTDSDYAVASCNGPVADHSAVATSSTGPQAFTVVAADSNGNPSSEDVVYFVGNAGLMPQSLAFPPEAWGFATAPQKVTLFNRQSSTLSISSIGTVIPGDDINEFTDTTTCGSTLAPLASCTISVIFTAEYVGGEQGSLSVSTGAGNFSIPLMAYSTPVVFDPDAYTFKEQTVGTTSAVHGILLKNTWTEALTISSINLTGDFALATVTGCTVPGEVGNGCWMGITFTPTTAGERTGTLTVQTSYPTAPLVVKLKGTGD